MQMKDCKVAMKILITGANGFIGRNLISELKKQGYDELFLYDIDGTEEYLNKAATRCDVIFHLAGINRPKRPEEFMEGNCDFTGHLIELVKAAGRTPLIITTSSIQAELDNPYGLSKKAAEDLLKAYAKDTGGRAIIYRLPNVFGKWCRPDYNSAVATFCHNIARDLPVKVNDPSVLMHLVYIDDVVGELIAAMKGEEHINEDGYGYIPEVNDVLLGDIPKLLYSFRDSRVSLELPRFDNPFEKKLYSTYLSYLKPDDFAYPLTMKGDERGSFTEFLRSREKGQVSVNVAHPGITKGNHWHSTKNEKFFVVAGEASIKFRKVGTDEIIEYIVSDKEHKVVDIPCGYTHSITNIGEGDLVTIMWVNEPFDPNDTDTFYEEV